MRPEGLGELTRDVRIRIAWLADGAQAVLVTIRPSRGRGLLASVVPLGALELDLCKIPRLRVVR